MALSPVTGSWTEFSPLRQSSFCWTRIGPLRTDFFVCFWNMDELLEWTFFRKILSKRTSWLLSRLNYLFRVQSGLRPTIRLRGKIKVRWKQKKSVTNLIGDEKHLVRTFIWNLVDLSRSGTDFIVPDQTPEFIWFKGAGGQHMADHRNWFYSVFWERRVRSISCYSPHHKILILPKINFGLKT